MPLTDACVASIVGLGSVLLAGETLDATLTRVVNLACRGIGSCDFASVTSFDRSAPRTLVSNDPIADEIDGAQYEDASGPCFDAFREQRAVSIPSIADGDGWMQFRDRARANGVRSALALPMRAGDVVCVLNLYGRDEGAFDGIAPESALLIADQAGVAVANTRTYHETRELVTHLESALETRDVIGQAQGIVMANEKVGAAEAFSILRRASQRRNVKLRDIAVEIIESGVTPLPSS